jgi:hypothetical protein
MIDANTTLVLTTDSEIYGLLNGVDWLRLPQAVALVLF